MPLVACKSIYCYVQNWSNTKKLSVCICAIRRTVLLPPLFKTEDYTFDIDKQLNWAAVEVNAGIICASVPALKPFFVRYLPMVVTTHITGSRSKNANINHRNYQLSMPYSTTIENNKKRRNVQSEAYKLHSHDEISLSSSEMPKTGSNEDIARLWSGSAFRNDYTGHRETIIEYKREETDASIVGSGDDIQPVAEGSRSKTPQRVASMSGIRVTTETSVVYEQS